MGKVVGFFHHEDLAKIKLKVVTKKLNNPPPPLSLKC